MVEEVLAVADRHHATGAEWLPADGAGRVGGVGSVGGVGGRLVAVAGE